MSKRQRFPRHLSRFFRWWFGGDWYHQRGQRYLYRESNRARGTVNVNVGVQPLGEIGATHNPDLPGARWVEPLPCGDDAFDSWDDAVYLGASWENFMPAEGQDPFTAPGGSWARVERIYGAEPRWGRLT